MGNHLKKQNMIEIQDNFLLHMFQANLLFETSKIIEECGARHA